jgi:hypothetical protein
LKFTPDEDAELVRLVEQLGTTDWPQVAAQLGTRNARQCREMYKNYLDPGLRHGEWTPAEDALLLAKHAKHGSKWNLISRFFEDRSDNALRNRWNHIRRRQGKASSRRVVPFERERPETVAEPREDPPAEPGPPNEDRIPEVSSVPAESRSCFAEPSDLSGHAIKTCQIIEGDPFELWSSIQWTKP